MFVWRVFVSELGCEDMREEVMACVGVYLLVQVSLGEFSVLAERSSH